MKTCPVCKARCFDDMEICYGCLHRFERDAAGESPQREIAQQRPDDPFQEGGAAVAAQHLPEFVSVPVAAPAAHVSAPVDAELMEPEQEAAHVLRRDGASFDAMGYRVMVDVRLVPLTEPSHPGRQTDSRDGGRDSHAKGRPAACAEGTTPGRQKKRSGDRRQHTQPHRYADAKPKNGSGAPNGRGSHRTHAS
jgi:hypothetical protein